MESNFTESDILGSLSSNALILRLAFAPELVYLHTFSASSYYKTIVS